MLIRNGNVLISGGFEQGISVRLRQDVISEVGEIWQASEEEKILDLEGDYLLPGFVDVHIHGFRGHDVMNGEQAIRCMSRDLARIGVAAFCPTTMSAPDSDTVKAVKGIEAVMSHPERNGARVLGAHLEGPFLSEKKAAAQRADCFRDPDPEWLENLTGNPQAVRLITIAPERGDSEMFVRMAVSKEIRVSIGHTDADAEMLHQAGDWGADHITHLFNAQSPLHHRSPGVPGAALTDDRFYCEMICDGKHLHEDTVRLIIRCKGAGKTVAITDAMEAACMPEGEYTLGGQTVIVRNREARLQDGTLAGSVLTMPEALYRLIHRYGTDPYDACIMCTETPAKSVGESTAGRITAGSPGILTRWTPDWKMKSVITPYGEICHSAC